MDIYKLLLIEDKQEAIEMLQINLRDEPFNLSFANNGIDGLKLFYEFEPHLLLIDITLPKMDGLSLCKKIRESSKVPILMLTARDADVDKAVAFGLGADDYLTKPYSPIELVARIKALLRRVYQFQEVEKPSKILGGSRLKLNPANHRVFFDKTEIFLSPLEYKLLFSLISNPGWVFTRSHLLEKVWGYDSEFGEETVTVHISNLRQKLGQEGAKLIKTVRSFGYLYEES
ncbi:MAG: response regulator transcription factor [Chloroflexota bacterium]